MDGVGLKFYELVLELQAAPMTQYEDFLWWAVKTFMAQAMLSLPLTILGYGVWMEEVYNFMN